MENVVLSRRVGVWGRGEK